MLTTQDLVDDVSDVFTTTMQVLAEWNHSRGIRLGMVSRMAHLAKFYRFTGNTLLHFMHDLSAVLVADNASVRDAEGMYGFLQQTTASALNMGSTSTVGTGPLVDGGGVDEARLVDRIRFGFRQLQAISNFQTEAWTVAMRVIGVAIKRLAMSTNSTNGSEFLDNANRLLASEAQQQRRISIVQFNMLRDMGKALIARYGDSPVVEVAVVP